PLERPPYLTSTRTASVKPWSFSEGRFANRRRSTRRGPRTSATKMCSRRFRATATLHGTARRRSFWRLASLSSAPHSYHAPRSITRRTKCHAHARQSTAWRSARSIGVGGGRDGRGDFGQVQVHRLGVAGGQDQGCALALLRADCAEDVGGGSTLVAGRAGGCRASPSDG